jgi:hypothetical protein
VFIFATLINQIPGKAWYQGFQEKLVTGFEPATG